MPQVSSTDRHSAIIVTFAPSSVRWHLNPTFITSTNQLLPNVKSLWNVLICAGIEYGFRNTEYERQLKYAGSFWYSVKRNCRKTLYKRLNKSAKDICLIGASNNMCCQVFEHKTKSPSWTDWKLACIVFVYPIVFEKDGLWRGRLHCIWKTIETTWDPPSISSLKVTFLFLPYDEITWECKYEIQNTKKLSSTSKDENDCIKNANYVELHTGTRTPDRTSSFGHLSSSICNVPLLLAALYITPPGDFQSHPSTHL